MSWGGFNPALQALPIAPSGGDGESLPAMLAVISPEIPKTKPPAGPNMYFGDGERP